MDFLRSYFEALRHPRAWWTLASNAIPVAGVLYFGWHALPLLVFYWIENVVIGAVNVLKILATGMTKPMPMPVAALFFVVFFVVHYGLFCFVHGTFVLAIFTMNDLVQGGVEPTSGAFDLVPRMTQILQLDRDLFWSACAMIVIRLGEFAVLWLPSGQWRAMEPSTQMIEPYGRVVVLHATIVLGAIPVISLGQPVLAVLILAVMKTGLELGLPLMARDGAKPPPSPLSQ